MPIELWWWVSPLCGTGLITLFVFGGLAILIDKMKPYNMVSDIFAWIAVTPWLISIPSTVVWFLINVLILIWR